MKLPPQRRKSTMVAGRDRMCSETKLDDEVSSLSISSRNRIAQPSSSLTAIKQEEVSISQNGYHQSPEINTDVLKVAPIFKKRVRRMKMNSGDSPVTERKSVRPIFIDTTENPQCSDNAVKDMDISEQSGLEDSSHPDIDSPDSGLPNSFAKPPTKRLFVKDDVENERSSQALKKRPKTDDDALTNCQQGGSQKEEYFMPIILPGRVRSPSPKPTEDVNDFSREYEAELQGNSPYRSSSSRERVDSEGSDNGGKNDRKAPLVERRTPSPPPPICGMTNLGNTCFLSSILQVLRFSPKMADSLMVLQHDCEQWLLSRKDTAEEVTISQDVFDKCQLVNEIMKLFRTAAEGEEINRKGAGAARSWKCLVQPRGVLIALRRINCLFEGFSQQDAHEALNTIVEAISTVEEAVYAESKVVVNDEVGSGACGSREEEDFRVTLLLKGKMNRIIRCAECEEETRREESFSDLSIPLRRAPIGSRDPQGNGDVSGDEAGIQSWNLTPRQKDVASGDYFKSPNGKSYRETQPDNSEIFSVDSQNWLIRNVRRSEKLSGNNKYKCANCLRQCEGSLTSEIINTPKLLVFHLKRFENPSTEVSCFDSEDRDGSTSSPTQGSWPIAIPKKIKDEVPIPLTIDCFLEKCAEERRNTEEKRKRDLKAALIKKEQKKGGRRMTRGFLKRELELKKEPEEAVIPVSKPEPLIVPNCESNDHKYELYGVVVHSGIGVSSGHYISYVRVPESRIRRVGELEPNNTKEGGEDGNVHVWLKCNDKKITVMENENCFLEDCNRFGSSYLLFYSALSLEEYE